MTDTVTLREHIEEILRLVQALSDERHRAVERQLEAANEWRSAMKDREAMFASKAEMQIELATIATRLAEITITITTSAGAKQGLNSIGTIVLGIGFIVSVGVAIAVAIFK